MSEHGWDALPIIGDAIQAFDFDAAMRVIEASVLDGDFAHLYELPPLLGLVTRMSGVSRETYLYIEGRQSDVRFAWGLLKRAMKTMRLYARFNEGRLRMEVASGSTLMLTSCSDDRSIDKLRGLRIADSYVNWPSIHVDVREYLKNVLAASSY